MRKKLTVEIETDGRDQGKMFLITEMDADKAERWAIRLGFALMNAGVDIPDMDNIESMSDVARIGLGALARVPYEAAEPLIAEMMDCVKIIPDPNQPKVVRDLIAEDIEEVATRLFLKREVFKLHVNFSTPAAASISE